MADDVLLDSWRRLRASMRTSDGAQRSEGQSWRVTAIQPGIESLHVFHIEVWKQPPMKVQSKQQGS